MVSMSESCLYLMQCYLRVWKQWVSSIGFFWLCPSEMVPLFVDAGFFFSRLISLCPSFLLRNSLSCSFCTHSCYQPKYLENVPSPVSFLVPLPFPAFCCSVPFFFFFTQNVWRHQIHKYLFFSDTVKSLSLNIYFFYVLLWKMWLQEITAFFLHSNPYFDWGCNFIFLF